MDRVKRATHHTAPGDPDPNCKPEGTTRAEFHWAVRVYYEDTDLGGVVYHANYLRFMERARTEWLRSLGLEQDVLRNHHSVQFVVVDAAVRFRQPARFNEELTVTVALTKQ